MSASSSAGTLKRKAQEEEGFVYKAKAGHFMHFKTQFLQHPLVVPFQCPVKIVRYGTAGSIRLGIASVSTKDQEVLKKHLKGMLTTFPLATESSSVQSFMPEGGLMFLKADKNTCAMYDTSRKLTALEDLPAICNCKIAIMLQGMKVVKNGDVSYMARVHQLLQTEEKVEVDDDEYDEEVKEQFEKLLF